jgi:polyisoprenoid-binding protein YceI
MHTLRYLAPIAALGLISAAAHAGGWNVATDSSSVGFSAEQQGGKFTGKFETFTATIDFDPAAPAEGSIVGTVVTESVDTRDYDRDASLMEPDWFDIDKYPEAKFESASIEAADDGSFIAHGNLTLKGETRPVDLSFSFDQNGDTASFSGKFAVDRFDYKVGEGWNDTYMVGKDIEVTIELALSR